MSSNSLFTLFKIVYQVYWAYIYLEIGFTKVAEDGQTLSGADFGYNWPCITMIVIWMSASVGPIKYILYQQILKAPVAVRSNFLRWHRGFLEYVFDHFIQYYMFKGVHPSEYDMRRGRGTKK